MLLGFLTSVSEFSVGVNSILEETPEIYVGNLLGASILIFLAIIPLLALVGSRLKITPAFQGFNLTAALVVVALPAFLIMDGKVDLADGFIAIFLFVFLTVVIQIKAGVLKRGRRFTQRVGVRTIRELLKCAFGVTLIFLASRFVVNQTEYFARIFEISPFLISLFLVSVGTNIPEFSLILRALFKKNSYIAFGGYIGSASMNTFLFGVLTLMNGRPIILGNNYILSLFFIIVGLMLFYHFAKTRNSISRREALALFLFYVFFFFAEILIKKNLS